MTLNMNREIRPEDFAIDLNRVWWSDDAGSQNEKREYYEQKAELKRLYELQEQAKAKAQFKREQARKDAIPYSEELCEEICKRISAGEFLTQICNDDHMPTVSRAIQWKKQHDDFGALYNMAVNDRLDIFEDEVVTIADETENDVKTVKKGNKTVKTVDGEVISRSKLRVDVRLKHLRAHRPEKWGEQSTLITKSVDETENLTMEELERKIADIDAKDSVPRMVA